MDNAFTFAKKSATCTEVSYSSIATEGTGKASSCIVRIARRSVAGYKDMSTDSEHVFNVDIGTAIRAHRPCDSCEQVCGTRSPGHQGQEEVRL